MKRSLFILLLVNISLLGSNSKYRINHAAKQLLKQGVCCWIPAIALSKLMLKGESYQAQIDHNPALRWQRYDHVKKIIAKNRKPLFRMAVFSTICASILTSTGFGLWVSQSSLHNKDPRSLNQTLNSGSRDAAIGWIVS